jgi:hypothetical protein
MGYLLMNVVSICAVIHAEDIKISLCDGNSEDEWRWWCKIGLLWRKVIHALKKRGRLRVDFRFPPVAISIEDVRDTKEERTVATFRERLDVHGLLLDKRLVERITHSYSLLPLLEQSLGNGRIQTLNVVTDSSRSGSSMPRRQCRCGWRC